LVYQEVDPRFHHLVVDMNRKGIGIVVDDFKRLAEQLERVMKEMDSRQCGEKKTKSRAKQKIKTDGKPLAKNLDELYIEKEFRFDVERLTIAERLALATRFAKRASLLRASAEAMQRFFDRVPIRLTETAEMVNHTN
ncbi:MAG: hypothetical protein ACK4UN_10350, partial [Limisphaerales bacterium]